VFRIRQMQNSCTTWRIFWICIPSPLMPTVPWFAQTKQANDRLTRSSHRKWSSWSKRCAVITNMYITANIFMFFAPFFQNWRYVRVTEHCRTPIWSSGCAILVDVHFLGAKPYHRGRGSLSTHNPVALYEVFEIA